METAHEEIDTVLDLDSLMAQPVEFILLGKTRVIKPFDLQTFLKTTNAMTALKDKVKPKTIEELAKQYFKLFSSCVDPITLDDVMQMKPAQCASLLALIIRRQYGEDLAKTYGQKKKTIPSQNIRKSMLQSLWQRLRFSSGGRQKRA